jgi:hypothetical protein
MKRRKFLISAIGAASVELLGCEGSLGGGRGLSAGVPRQTALPGAVVWDPSPLLFLAGRFSSIDLSLTLPPGDRRGGVFSWPPTAIRCHRR